MKEEEYLTIQKHTLPSCAWCGAHPKATKAPGNCFLYVRCNSNECPFYMPRGIHEHEWFSRQEQIRAIRRKDFEAGAACAIRSEIGSDSDPIENFIRANEDWITRQFSEHLNRQQNQGPT